jgi:predicted nuclease with TOPRIM domain
MPRGGYHPDAERWGRKPAWNDSETKTIRVPKMLAEEILEIAHKLDNDETIDFETKANQDLQAEASRLKTELEQMREQLAALKGENAELRSQSKQQQDLPDLEQKRDRFLNSLRLGKQAPEYRRSKKALDGFIAFIRSA